MFLAKSNSGKEFSVDITDNGILINGQSTANQIEKISDKLFQVIHHRKVYLVEILTCSTNGKEVNIKVNQNKYQVNLKDNLDQVMDKMGISAGKDMLEKDIKAPMPGMILDIMAKEGQLIKKGDTLLVLEAMKMENVIKAPAEVSVKKILVAKGDSVEKKQVLIEFDL